MVTKASVKWRMCINFIDFNKSCPKDVCPLLSINKLVGSASRYHYLSFMDGPSGYNQIKMDPRDEEKTSFIIEQSNFCYKVISFGLKNIGEAYQKPMSKVFTNFVQDDVLFKINLNFLPL